MKFATRPQSMLLALALAAVVPFAGCVGAAFQGASLLVGGLFVLSLFVTACARSHRRPDPEQPIEPPCALVCDDGSCAPPGETCPVEPSCEGVWEQACDNGQLVPACCPTGVACNYGAFVICDDGTCNPDPSLCVENTCDGTWEQACDAQGQVVELCCPANTDCNYGATMEICFDGRCVNAPDLCAPDPALCEGTWETYCDMQGQVVSECCPPNTICNFSEGSPYTLCDNDTCVTALDSCHE